MEIKYCDTCGTRLLSGDLQSEASKRTGSATCSKCAALDELPTSGLPAVGPRDSKAQEVQKTSGGVPGLEVAPADNVTRFYFCETCGKRITDKQILEGLGRDKKLKGIYCKTCAVGVTTMEFEALPAGDVPKIVRKSGENVVLVTPDSLLKSKSVQSVSRAAISPVKRSESRPSKPGVRLASQNGIKPVALAVAGAGILVVLGIFLLNSQSRPRSNPNPDRPVASSTEGVKLPDMPLPVAPEAPKEIARPPTLPVATKTEAIQESPPKPDPESQATVDYDNMIKRVGSMDKGDSADRLACVDSFLKAHGDSKLAPSAQTLRDGINAVQQFNQTHAVLPAISSQPIHDLKQPAAEIPIAKAADSVLATQRLLQQTLALLSLPDLPSAIRSVDQNPDVSGDTRNALKAALELLRKRDMAWREALSKNVGHKIRLETRAGIVEGTLLAGEGDSLSIDKPLIFDGAVKGSATVSVAIADILPDSREAIAPLPAPATIDEWMGQALSYMAKQDFEKAQTALARCDGHALQGALRNMATERNDEKREKDAASAWGVIETRAQTATTLVQAKNLMNDVNAFDKQFGKTKWSKNPRQLERVAALNDELKRIQAGADPAMARAFRGKLEVFEPRVLKFQLHYDFKKDASQLEDWSAKPFAGNESSYVHADENGLSFRAGGRFAKYFKCPFVNSGDFSLAFTYKKLAGSRILVWFQGDGSKGKSAAMTLVIGTKAIYLSNPTDSVSRENLDTGEVIARSAVGCPPSGKMEMGCQGDRYYFMVDGKVLLEHKSAKPNDHTGIVWGSGWDTSIAVQDVVFTGRASPLEFDKWVAEHKPNSSNK